MRDNIGCSSARQPIQWLYLSDYPTYRELAPAAGGKARGILRFVMAVRPTRTKFIIVVFALAMLYRSICSVSCVAGGCPNLGHYSESHECNQPSRDHSHGQHNNGQHDPDCKQHGHPSDFVLKASGIAAFQDQGASVPQAAMVIDISNPVTTTQDTLQESHRRRLGVPKDTLHKQVLVIRI